MALLKVMSDSRARLLLSTDSPNLFNAPGFSIHREMEMMAEAGMTPFQILRSGTAQVGEYLKQDCGVIKVGACADLLLLDRNPLADVHNVNHPTGVIFRGSWLSASEITRRLELIRNNPVNY